MTKPSLHPWLATSEAFKAAGRAVKIPQHKMAGAAQVVGADELLSEALTILTECALPPRERGKTVCAECSGSLELVRSGAKFCGAKCLSRNKVRRHRHGGELPPSVPLGHIGSMWSWPADKMQEYAAREVGLRLCHFLVSRSGRPEVPSSQWLENSDIPDASACEPEAREVLEGMLPAKLRVDNNESARDLLECVVLSRGIRAEGSETIEDLAEAARWLDGISSRRIADDDACPTPCLPACTNQVAA